MPGPLRRPAGSHAGPLPRRHRTAAPYWRPAAVWQRLGAPATTPDGSWFTEQCHLSAKKELASDREDYLTVLAPDWRQRAHLGSGADRTTLTRVTQVASVKVGSWPARQSHAARTS
ncbi:hypothetical protein [Streptomyces olivaceoviridis]|uniref:hypothetical protein n=1 Tax=Streptomyces olivaceoviridis TaxID=1921 RepID=UPI003700FAC4